MLSSTLDYVFKVFIDMFEASLFLVKPIFWLGGYKFYIGFYIVDFAFEKLGCSMAYNCRLLSVRLFFWA